MVIELSLHTTGSVHVVKPLELYELPTLERLYLGNVMEGIISFIQLIMPPYIDL